jgi:hypothetical protein
MYLQLSANSKPTDIPDLAEAFYCLEDREKHLKEKASCVQSVTTYLAKTGENLLDLLAHNTFNECAKASKQIGQNVYKKINSDQRNSGDIRCRFKAALRCLEAAVYLLMDVLKAHSQRATEKLANMSVVSSYHSTATQARDTSYFKKSKLFRDLMESQNDKANKLKALIEMGALDDNDYTDLGLKGIALHRYMQDRRQVYHDTALTKPMDLLMLGQEVRQDLKKK